MSPNIQNTIALFSRLIPLRWLKSAVKFPPFLPFYHVVSNNQHEFINSYVVRSVLQFEIELDYLLEHFKPVGLSEIMNSPANNKMHLSFDDGLKECYSIIAPILTRKGIPATFFVNPSFVDNQQLFHRFKRAILESKGILKQGSRSYYIQNVNELDQLANNNGIDFSRWQPYMNYDEIVDLKKSGFTIGAHSLDHPEMWTLCEEDQFQQVIQSMQWVNEHFQPEVKAFSFPFTDNGLSMSLFNRIIESKKIDITFGTAGLKFDSCPIHLQRVPIERNQNWSIQKVVHFEYFYSLLRSIMSSNQVLHQ